MNSKPSRPPGLIAIIVITAVFSVFGLLICGLGLISVSAVEVPVPSALLILVCFALSVAEAVACFGLWNWESWAFKLAKAVYTLNIVLSAVSIFWSESPAEVIVNLVSIATYIWMLSYLNSDRIRTLYVGGPSAAPGDRSKSSEPALQPRDRFFS